VCTSEPSWGEPGNEGKFTARGSRRRDKPKSRPAGKGAVITTRRGKNVRNIDERVIIIKTYSKSERTGARKVPPGGNGKPGEENELVTTKKRERSCRRTAEKNKSKTIWGKGLGTGRPGNTTAHMHSGRGEKVGLAVAQRKGKEVHEQGTWQKLKIVNSNG